MIQLLSIEYFLNAALCLRIILQLRLLATSVEGFQGGALLDDSTLSPFTLGSDDTDIVKFAYHTISVCSSDYSSLRHLPPSIERPSSIAFSMYGLSANGSSAIVRAALTSS